MKKWIGSFFLFFALVGTLLASHLGYLYTHRKFIPSDFAHPFILSLQGKNGADERKKQEIKKILRQRFSYLGCGKQMTAYVSEDQRYVIKFFNPRAVTHKEWFMTVKKLRRLVSLRWISTAYFKKKQRLIRLFERYQLAFDEIPEESGLIYLHLDPSTCLSQSLQVIDKRGRSFEVDLNQSPFVLQEHGELVTTYFSHLMEQGEKAQAEEGIKALHAMFYSRAQKGITDRIQTVHNNYGFVNGRAIQIDLGRIRKDEAVALEPEKEVERIFARVGKAIIRRYPELSSQVIDLQ